jgi:hypothetical protein
MKNYKELFKVVIEYYQNEFEMYEKKEIIDIARIETFLYVLEKLDYVDKDISLGWTLLNGYQENNGCNIKQIAKNKQELLRKARCFLLALQSSTTYGNVIEAYMSISCVNDLMYSLNIENKEIFFKANISKRLEERRKLLKSLFQSEIDIQESKMEFFGKNKGVFNNDGILESVDFSRRIPDNIVDFNKVNVKREYTNSVIIIKKKDLLETAKYIDSKIENKNYIKRVQNISFDVIEENRIYPCEEITINGLFNLVGRVGAGKSTLVEVLSCKLALEGRKTAIIVDSIRAIIELLKYFNKLNIKAVPIWGYRGKEGQRNKAYTSVDEEDFGDVKCCEFNKWFAETCILDGLRDSSDISDCLQTGMEPCMKIKENKKSKKNYACPYYNVCPSHIVDRSLEEAQVYITTPAAFLKTKISPVLVNGNIRVSEYLYYNCDLVVFDESDRVQLNFEQGFTEHLVLMDHSEECYLNKLGSSVEKWFYKNRLINASNKRISEWYDICNNTQRISNIIIKILNDNKSLIKKLNGGFSTAFSLHGRFENDFEFKRCNTKFDMMNDFISKGEKELDDEGQSIRIELLSGNIDIEKISFRIKSWYFKEDNIPNDALLMIIFIFILNVFEKSFKNMVNGLENIPELNDINIENANIMFRGIEDYLPFVPTAPTGNKFGIRVTADNNNNLKRIVLFRNRGLGRWLLTNYYNMYQGLGCNDGTNVLLLSGTSWAPKSYSYNVDIPVNAILNGHEAEAESIEKSKFKFEYTLINNNPVNVSGTDLDVRIEKIKTIVNSLVKATGRIKKSKLEQELERLDEGRKRILLLVGSYAEAAAVKLYLDSILKADGAIKRDEVSLLVRDDEEISEEDISRGDVTKFGNMNKKILIAPLMALERGYNILNEDNKAAIGSVYFLVRPMPVPNDLSIVINKINSEAIKKLNYKKSKDILEHMRWVKYNRDESLRTMQTLLVKSERLGYKQLDCEARDGLCMTLFVTMCQVIGRLIRGGCEARVHFCDAKFAPNTVINKEDTESTSILVGIIKTVDKLLKSEDIIERELAEKLYYPFYKGLKDCEGLRYGK